MYRSSIGIDDKTKFGVEIEFSSASLITINQELKKRRLPVSFEVYHNYLNLPYDVWYLDQDSSVTKYIDNKVIGGELSSRILTDTKNTWLELKKICQTLRENNAKASNKTSTHVTVDISSFEDQRILLEALYKIIAYYEIEMNTFYMGDKYLVRDTKERYARNISLDLINNYQKIDFSSYNLLNNLLEKEMFTNKTGLNFSKIKEKGLIEFRYPNGTLNEKTIQNNINFTLKLLKAIKEEKFDLEELDYLIKTLQESYLDCYYILENISNSNKFFNLVQTISTNSLDEEDFYTQYQKVLQKRHF